MSLFSLCATVWMRLGGWARRPVSRVGQEGRKARKTRRRQKKARGEGGRRRLRQLLSAKADSRDWLQHRLGGRDPEGRDCDSRSHRNPHPPPGPLLRYGGKTSLLGPGFDLVRSGMSVPLQRFAGCGLGPRSHGLRIDVYGRSGDYLGSGLDGAQIYVHGSAQDQVGQIMKEGKLVIFGDMGQTLLYGAKGGEAYVLGNAAGRPLINAVGRPRVVINGTCLDYLAKSFMASEPLHGGGSVVLNNVAFDDHGQLRDLDNPLAIGEPPLAGVGWGHLSATLSGK